MRGGIVREMPHRSRFLRRSATGNLGARTGCMGTMLRVRMARRRSVDVAMRCMGVAVPGAARVDDASGRMQQHLMPNAAAERQDAGR